jgi:hypothetical protein
VAYPFAFLAKGWAWQAQFQISKTFFEIDRHQTLTVKSPDTPETNPNQSLPEIFDPAETPS